MPTADTHHRCGEVHFCFRRAVGRRRCLLDFVTQTGYCFSLLLFGIVSLLLFLSATAWEEFFLDSHRYPAATRHLPA